MRRVRRVLDRLLGIRRPSLYQGNPVSGHWATDLAAGTLGVQAPRESLCAPVCGSGTRCPVLGDPEALNGPQRGTQSPC